MHHASSLRRYYEWFGLVLRSHAAMERSANREVRWFLRRSNLFKATKCIQRQRASDIASFVAPKYFANTSHSLKKKEVLSLIKKIDDWHNALDSPIVVSAWYFIALLLFMQDFEPCHPGQIKSPKLLSIAWNPLLGNWFTTLSSSVAYYLILEAAMQRKNNPTNILTGNAFIKTVQRWT